MTEFVEVETVKGHFSRSASGRYWPVDGKDYDFICFDVWSRLDVFNEECVHRFHVMAVELVEYDWNIVL